MHYDITYFELFPVSMYITVGQSYVYRVFLLQNSVRIYFNLNFCDVQIKLSFYTLENLLCAKKKVGICVFI